MLRLMKFSELFVFVVIWSMCLPHDKSREILIPKYFAESVSFSLTQWSIYFYTVGFFLLVTLITSYLSGLNDINHSLSQFSSLVRSFCRTWQSVWFETVRYMIVSSAKSLILLCIVSGISFMYRRNRHCPNTEPCGTPDMTGHDSDSSKINCKVWFWV